MLVRVFFFSVLLSVVFTAEGALVGVSATANSKLRSDCPFGMVSLMGIGANERCIDVTEAAVEVFDNSTGEWRLHQFNLNLDEEFSSNVPFRAVSPLAFQRNYKKKETIGDGSSDGKVMPQAYISQQQAARACEAAGKRLCSGAEYDFGCGGPSKRTFPYGNTYQKGWCNEGNPNPVPRLYPDPKWTYQEMNNPALDTLPNTLALPATYVNCSSFETGTFDMAGNLDEWVADVTPQGNGVFRGGYFVDDTINGRGCTYRTVAHAPSYHDYSLGFRCCWAP